MVSIIFLPAVNPEIHELVTELGIWEERYDSNSSPQFPGVGEVSALLPSTVAKHHIYVWLL